MKLRLETTLVELRVLLESDGSEFCDVRLFQGHRELSDGSAIEVELQDVVHTFTLAREAIASVVKAKVDI